MHVWVYSFFLSVCLPGAVYAFQTVAVTAAAVGLRAAGLGRPAEVMMQKIAASGRHVFKLAAAAGLRESQLSIWSTLGGWWGNVGEGLRLWCPLFLLSILALSPAVATEKCAEPLAPQVVSSTDWEQLFSP